jgi:hypothetical protein
VASGLALGLVGWLGFLMLANGVLHLVATVIDGAYCPGAITSGVLVTGRRFFW